MKWIKYKIHQSTMNGEDIFVDKKVGYNEANLAIAQKEAYSGYEIVEDGASFSKEPIAVEFGGTGASDSKTACENLGAVHTSEYYGAIRKSGSICSANCYAGSEIHVKTHIEPVQAGSGDPYPAGGGKNLTGFAAPESIYGLTVSAEEHGFKIVGNCTESYNQSLFESSVLKAGRYTLSARMRGSVSNGGANLYISVDSTMYTIWKNGSLDGVYSRTFDLSADAERWAIRIACDSGATYDVAITDIQLEIGSTATAYVPYSNIRPITGYAGAKLTKCGKNLISRPYIDASKTENGITIKVNDDGSISANGTPNAQTRFTLVDKFTLLPGTYTLSGIDKATTGHVDIQVFDPSYNTLAHVNNYGKAANTFTITEATAVKINIYFGAGNAAEWTWIRPQLELGSTATAYEPYQGETFSANFGQTVYGGTMDWNTGVLTVDKACIAFDGTEAAAMQAENSSWARYNLTGRPTNALLPAYTAICSHFRTRQKTTTEPELVNTVEIHGSNNYPIFRVDNSKWSTVEAFKSYLAEQYAAGTPVQILYELAEPTVIQLTPAQITAFHGMNYIYCDAGIVESAYFGYVPRYNIIYSANEPAYEAGAIWLKPIE